MTKEVSTPTSTQGNRGFFRETGVVALGAAPDVRVQTRADFCRPYQDRGPVVDAVRAKPSTSASLHVAERDAAPLPSRSAA